MTAPKHPHSPVLILGSGIAGLSLALRLAEKTDVILMTKDRASEGATRYAQGGIASVWSKEDSFENHIQDTLTAGGGLCRPQTVQFVVSEGPAAVRRLIDLGVPFTRADGHGPADGLDPTEVFDLHREGGHSRRRILHADDLTGWAIEKTLLEKVTAHPRIRLEENKIAIDLITEAKLRGGTDGRVLGAYILDTVTENIYPVSANFTVLATGGAGKAYLYTSNPDVATGDGIAMAYRAGARVANLEFMQFHPTCLYHPDARTYLITEALRGEGAILRNLLGEAFMDRYHPLASLAPRDIVSRAIDAEIKRLGHTHVLLDTSPIPAEEFKKKFPNIYETCMRYGIDPTLGSIPVVPAAHYLCGGVQVGDHGETTLPGLFALGETACTGLHGANRLASNSLLEAVVYAERIGAQILDDLIGNSAMPNVPDHLPEWDVGKATEVEDRIDIAASWKEIRTLMWNFVGIVRTNRRLERAKRRLDLLETEITADYWRFKLNREMIELRNLMTVSQLTVQAAMSRKESRGLHYNVDYPGVDDRNFGRDTVL
jgi:L-aspartate oxidase